MHVLMTVNAAWNIVNFRMPLVAALIADGHRITVLAPPDQSTPEIAERGDALYAKIITAGTFRAESIKVAEATQVIENIQRDLNIVLVNELAIIFARMGIDTSADLEAGGPNGTSCHSARVLWGGIVSESIPIT